MASMPTRVRPVPLFVVAAGVVALTFAGLGWTLVQKDRVLDQHRMLELLDATATRVAATIERELDRIDRQLPELANGSQTMSRDPVAVAVRINREGRVVEAHGSPLVFEPASADTTNDSASDVWIAAERLEFSGDLRGAIGAYRQLSSSANDDVRAGALIRLARVFKKTGKIDDAFSAYDEVAAIKDAAIAGDPADLLARWVRVDLLQSQGRHDDARREAQALDRDIRSRSRHLHPAFALSTLESLRHFRDPTEQPLVDEQVALTEAVSLGASASRDATDQTDGRRLVRVGSVDVLVVIRSGRDDRWVFAALPRYLASALDQPATDRYAGFEFLDESGRPLAGRAISAPPRVAVTKSSSEAHLPWALRVSAADLPPELARQAAWRGRAVAAAVVVVSLVLLIAGYAIGRAVRQELALARQRADFVAAVSHELRSPLTALAHASALLRSDFSPTVERRRQYYDAIAHETDRLRRFVETLLDFGRIQSAGGRYRRARCDLAAAASRWVEEFRCAPSAAGRVVTLIAGDALPEVEIDGEALERAVWNLLENAAKYSPAGTPITVLIQEDEGRVALSVQDRGYGIPAEEQSRVFDEFFRGANATESAVKGTGVGLAIVRHVVTAQGGEIRLTSELGVGSTFTILFPPADVTTLADWPRRRIS